MVFLRNSQRFKRTAQFRREFDEACVQANVPGAAVALTSETQVWFKLRKINFR